MFGKKKNAKCILSCLFRRYEHFDIKIISFRFEMRKLWTYKVSNGREIKFNVELEWQNGIWRWYPKHVLIVLEEF